MAKAPVNEVFSTLKSYARKLSDGERTPAEIASALNDWAHDSLALALPSQVICRPTCLGLCPRCGIDLNADPGHQHEADKDPRWSKLDDLKFD